MKYLIPETETEAETEGGREILYIRGTGGGDGMHMKGVAVMWCWR